MKNKKIIILISIVLLIGYILMQCLPFGKVSNNTLFYHNEDVLIIAHGGSKKLYPENTVYAFEQVSKYHVDALEVDLRLSKDHYLVGVHDDKINEYTDKKGYVFKYTYEQLCQMNFGYHFQNDEGQYIYRDVEKELEKKLVPVELKQLLNMYQKDMLYLLEIKDRGERGKEAARRINDIVVEMGLQKQVSVCSFDQEIMNYFNQIKDKDISSVMDYKTSEKFVVANYYGYGIFLDFPFDGLMLPTKKRDIALDDKYLIYKAHKNNKYIFYWTIDNKKEMKKLIDYGVDGIISDRVDRLEEVLNDK